MTNSPRPHTQPRFARRKILTSTRRLLTVCAFALITASAARAQDASQKWVGTWAVSPQTQEAFLAPTAPAPPVFTNQTLRQIAHTSIGGSRVRVRFSNALGTSELVIGAAHFAFAGAGAQTVAGTDHVLTFGGRAAVTIPPGALVLSDPVDLTVPAFSNLAVSLYLPNATDGTSTHSLSSQNNYVLDGDQTAATDPMVSATQLPYYFLTNVEVVAARSVRGIVTLGDSITDGFASTTDANHRWPNYFAERLLRKGGGNHLHDAAVLNQGISGNRLLHNVIGPNALSRIDRDVIAQTGVTDVILLEGINDIGFGGFVPAELVSAEDIIAAYRQIIARAHDAGLKIYGCTLTPFAVTNAVPGYYSDAGEAKRQTVNAFVRTGGEFDGVIDFEAALRDNSNPPQMLPQYDSGDHLHPNDAGYQAMANAIPLKFFKHTP